MQGVKQFRSKYDPPFFALICLQTLSKGYQQIPFTVKGCIIIVCAYQAN